MNWENTKAVLNEFGEALAELYKEKLAAEGVNTEKKSLSDSVTPVIDEGDDYIELGISLLYYWKWIEEGRPPTENKGDGSLRKKIEQWIIDKPIIPQAGENGDTPSVEELSYIITNKIHQYGWYNKPDGNGGYSQYEGKHLMQNSINEIKKEYISKIDEAVTQDLSEDIDYIFAAIK